MNNYNHANYLVVISRKLFCALSMGMLLACEATLDVAGVEGTLAEAVRRTDQFQAVAENDQVQVAVGNYGVVLHRPLGQSSWQRRELPGQPGLIDLAVCPNNTFVALSFDRQLWTASEDAKHWQAKTIETPENLLAIACAPDNRVWVVGSFSTLLSSTDAGATWSEFSLNEDAMLTSIQFLSETMAYATGEFGVVVKTVDAGVNWEMLPPIQSEFYPQTTLFLNEQVAWSVGLDGTAYQTDNGGESWSLIDTGVDAPLYDILSHENNLLLLGDNATLLQQEGTQWRPVRLDVPPVYLRSGLFDGEQVLLAGGNGVLMNVDL